MTKPKLADFGINLLLLVSSSVLFAMAHPNFLVYTGVAFVAYFAFIPILLLIRRVSLPASFLWGGIYGMLNYILFSYWLWSFHPLAIYIVAIEYFLYYLVTIPLLKLADIFFPRFGFIVQCLIWISYEYIRTFGFLGFSYGLIGYSQWQIIPLIQIASVCGVWAVALLVFFPSSWIAAGIKSNCTKSVNCWLQNFSAFAKKEWIFAVVWFICFVASLIFGILQKDYYKKVPVAHIALIQPNADPWVGNTEFYRKQLAVLKNLSDNALAADENIALVVWPETAFIPRIDWHYRYRTDRDSFALVHDLLTYLDSKKVPFLIGNDDAIRTQVSGNSQNCIDYNALLLFKPKENIIPPNPERYYKMHLVPFTEHFPYKKWFPQIYHLLESNDTHFWEKGTDPRVFSVNGLTFGTPICFEDTFGYISRRFAQNGATLIINTSNDAWANSIVCQYQHLSMSVFRAVETGLPVLRATASGQTAAITPQGTIKAMLEPFTAGYLCVTVPVITKAVKTGYVKYGDILAIFCITAASITLLIGCIRYIMHTRRRI